MIYAKKRLKRYKENTKKSESVVQKFKFAIKQNNAKTQTKMAQL